MTVFIWNYEEAEFYSEKRKKKKRKRKRKRKKEMA